MPEGQFTQDLLGTRVRLNVSPELQFTSFLQYDTESSSFGTNTRVRWTFAPLGDLFLVYNHNLRTSDPLTLQRELVFASNQLLVKAQHAFRYYRTFTCSLADNGVLVRLAAGRGSPYVATFIHCS